MKFCPKCGNSLPDDAKFCTKCGALQPGFENENPAPNNEQPVAQPVPQPTPQEMSFDKPNPSMSPRERFDYLYEHDERFKTIVRCIRRCGLVALINLLFIVPWLVCLLTPVGAFTGVNVHPTGQSTFEAMGIYNFPHPYSALSIRTFTTIVSAAGKAITPGDSLKNPMALLLFIFGFVWIPLMVLAGVLGNPRGYLLTTYEKEGGYKELIKRAKGGSLIMFGAMYDLICMVCAIMTYVNSTDLNYKAGDTYYFGEVTGLKEGMITCIVVTVIFMIIMIVTQAVLKSIINRSLKEYDK